jgi:hypothetical protein
VTVSVGKLTIVLLRAGVISGVVIKMVMSGQEMITSADSPYV